MKKTEKNKYKLKGEAYWLPFAMVKELILIYFLIEELAHLPLRHPTVRVFRKARKTFSMNVLITQEANNSLREFIHPP